MAKDEKPTLPFSYTGDSRFTKDCFCHMRNNVCEMAQFLKHGLLGRLFMRADGRHIEGGFPHRPIDFGRKTNLKSDQELDTRFHESVGMYQALHEDDNFRLNALNVFALGHVLRNAATFCVKYRFKLQLLIDATISITLPKFKITRNVLPGPGGDRSEFNGTFGQYEVTGDTYWGIRRKYYLPENGDWRELIPGTEAEVMAHTADYIPGSRIPAGKDYYVKKDTLFYEVHNQSQYEPKIHEFYVEIPPDDNTTLADFQYYIRVDPPAGSTSAPTFRECAILDSPEINTYYTYDEEQGQYVPIEPHNLGDLQGKDIFYYTLRPGSSTEHYYVNAGQAWAEEHPLGTWLVIIPGLTRYPSSTPEKYTLYRKVQKSDADVLSVTNPLYVDCTDEDVERLKDYCNLLLYHYRTILIITGRKRPYYREIVDGIRFTITDIMIRINDLVDCCEFTKPDGTHIEHLDRNNYTIREMKLKFNELVDALVNEAYFLRVVKPRVGSFEERMSMKGSVGAFMDEIGFNEKAWEDLIVSSLRPGGPLESTEQNYDEVTPEWDGYCYNDLGFVYNPYEYQFYNAVWDALDFTTYGDDLEPGADPAGTMIRRMGSWVTNEENPTNEDGYDRFPKFRIDDVETRPLTECIDLVHIADVWRACDYVGSLYSIDAFCRMFNAVVPDGSGNNWSVGLEHPWDYVDFAQHSDEFDYNDAAFGELLEEIRDLETRLRLLFNAVQLAAYTIVDLGLRISDYSVIYTCE